MTIHAVRRRALVRLSLAVAAIALPGVTHADPFNDPFVVTQVGTNGADSLTSHGGEGQTLNVGASLNQPYVEINLTGGHGGNGANANGGGFGGFGGDAFTNIYSSLFGYSAIGVGRVTGGNGGLAGYDPSSSTHWSVGKGGDAGATVNASASNLPATSPLSLTASATSVATGGNAGNNSAGSPYAIAQSAGNATANASANGSFITAATASATATGGTGSYSIFGGAGGNAFATAIANNQGGDATASVTAIGGRGGDGLLGAGGSGASVALHNAASGQASGAFGQPGGTLSLSQTAIGGDGGSASDNPSSAADGGFGGSATSVLELSDYTASQVNVSLSAIGGKGGRSTTHNGGGGGYAYVSASIYAIGSINLNVSAVGGNGGDGTHGFNSGTGPGGGAGFNQLYANSNTGSVTVNASLTGFSGGNASIEATTGTIAGDGQNIFLDNAINAYSSTSISLAQSARGGNGGSAYYTTGQAGLATSRLTRFENINQLSLTTNATGGNGGSSLGALLNGGDGATANAETMAYNNLGTATAVANSTAGTGGSVDLYTNNLPPYSRTGGNGGQATSRAEASSPVAAVSISSAIGGQGGSVGLGTLNGVPSIAELVAAGPGAGGNASATSAALGNPPSPNATAFASATAVGGNGGLADYQTNFDSYSRGGDASARAFAEAPGGATAFAEAIGGRGGSVVNIPAGGVVTNGGSGGNALLEGVYAAAVTGDASATGIVRGGAPGTTTTGPSGFPAGGGVSFFNRPTASSISGNASATLLVYGSGASDPTATGVGASVSLFSEVYATSQTGAIALRQEAHAGNGEIGGNATSYLSGNSVPLNSSRGLSLMSRAVGGITRDSVPNNILGGTAFADSSFTVPTGYTGPITLVAEAKGAPGAFSINAHSGLTTAPGSYTTTLTAAAGHLATSLFPAVSASATAKGAGINSPNNVYASAAANPFFGGTSGGDAAVTVNPFLLIDPLYAIPGLNPFVIRELTDPAPVALSKISFATNRDTSFTTEVDLSATSFDDDYLAVAIPTFFSSTNLSFTLAVQVQNSTYTFSFADLQAAGATFLNGVLAFPLDPTLDPTLSVTLRIPQSSTSFGNGELNLAILSATDSTTTAIPEPTGLLFSAFALPLLRRRR